MLPVVARAAAGRVVKQANKTGGSGEKPSLLLFGGLTIIALLKDILDFIGLGSLPVIGTAVTLCFSFVIFMLLLTFDRSGGRGNKRIAQGIVMTFFTLIEGLGFVLNFLPLQTLTIVFLYRISYQSWREAQKSGVLTSRSMMKKERVQQARMARAVAAEKEQEVLAQTAASSGAVVNTAAVSAAGRAPRMADTRSLQAASGQSTERRGAVVVPPRFSPSQGAANDASYTAGQGTADPATLRIREAGSRLSRPSFGNPSASTGAPRTAGVIPTQRSEVRRAA